MHQVVDAADSFINRIKALLTALQGAVNGSRNCGLNLTSQTK